MEIILIKKIKYNTSVNNTLLSWTMKKIKIQITKEMKKEINEIARECGLPERDTEPEELECLYG